jgi:hypothetical protein
VDATFSFEDGHLLAKGEDLKRRIGSAAEENAHRGEDGENAMKHQMIVVTEGRSPPNAARFKSLIPHSDPILSTDKCQSQLVLSADGRQDQVT